MAVSATCQHFFKYINAFLNMNRCNQCAQKWPVTETLFSDAAFL